jgi:hypothetical protein
VCAGPELHQAERLEPALLAAAEYVAVEVERALEATDTQHHVVEADDLDGAHGSFTSKLPR